MADILGVAVGGSFCWPESLWDPQQKSFFFYMWGTLIPSHGVPFAYPPQEENMKHPP